MFKKTFLLLSSEDLLSKCLYFLDVREWDSEQQSLPGCLPSAQKGGVTWEDLHGLPNDPAPHTHIIAYMRQCEESGLLFPWGLWDRGHRSNTS